MIRRRVLPRRSDEEWEQLIKACLTAGKGPGWGCLAKTGKLFRIDTLSHVQVPPRVIDSLEARKQIILKDDGYYKFVQRRRRRVF